MTNTFSPDGATVTILKRFLRQELAQEFREIRHTLGRLAAGERGERGAGKRGGGLRGGGGSGARRTRHAKVKGSCASAP